MRFCFFCGLERKVVMSWLKIAFVTRYHIHLLHCHMPQMCNFMVGHIMSGISVGLSGQAVVIKPLVLDVRYACDAVWCSKCWRSGIDVLAFIMVSPFKFCSAAHHTGHLISLPKVYRTKNPCSRKVGCTISGLNISIGRHCNTVKFSCFVKQILFYNEHRWHYT